MFLKKIKVLGAIAILMVVSVPANALIIDTWATNEGLTGNYTLTATDNGGLIDFILTVDPWNAEALGLFLDFGDVTIDDTVVLTNINPTGQVSLFATDTTSDSCGSGCNLQGLNPEKISPDGEWEYVFFLGSQGFDGIQTFSWSINDNGQSVSDIVMAGVRAQNLCPDGEVLTTTNNDLCDGSDKSVSVSEPSIIALFGLGIIGLGLARRRTNEA